MSKPVKRSDTPKWDTFCKMFDEVHKVRRVMEKEQYRMVNAIQTDMNIPGPDNTSRILEEHIDLKLVWEILQPLFSIYEKGCPDEKKNTERKAHRA